MVTHVLAGDPPLQGFWLVPWLDSMPKDKQREVLATALDHMRSGLLPPAKGGWGTAHVRANVLMGTVWPGPR